MLQATHKQLMRDLIHVHVIVASKPNMLIPRSHLVEPHQLIPVEEFQECSTHVIQEAIVMCPYAEIAT